jgi:hypothetical protein
LAITGYVVGMEPMTEFFLCRKLDAFLEFLLEES